MTLRPDVAGLGVASTLFLPGVDSEVPVAGGRDSRLVEMKELYEAAVEGKPMAHDGRWAMATLEVGNTIIEAARERRKILLIHQTPLRD